MAAVAAFILPSTHAQAQTFCANLDKDGGFEILFGLLEDNELCVALDGLNKGTLLAPTDEAFFELPPGIFECLLIAPDQLIDLLSYHVIEEDFSSSVDLAKIGEPGGTINTLQGESISVTSKFGIGTGINDAFLEEPLDQFAENGKRLMSSSLDFIHHIELFEHFSKAQTNFQQKLCRCFPCN